MRINLGVLSLMVLLCLTIISTVDRLPISKLDDFLIVYMYISFPIYAECGASLNYAPLRRIVEFLQSHIDNICQSIPNYTWADFDYSYLLASNPDRLIGTHKASIGNLRWLRKTEITCLGSTVAGRFRIDARAFMLLRGGNDELTSPRTSHSESVLGSSVLKHIALSTTEWTQSR